MSVSDPTVFEVFLTLSRTMRGLFDARAQATGLTYARARLLVTIARHEGATQTELANLLQIETPTLKRQLDALEDLGLAERRMDESDARKHAVFLTGKARLASVIRFREEIETALRAGVSPADIETTRRTLALMALNAESLCQK